MIASEENSIPKMPNLGPRLFAVILFAIIVCVMILCNSCDCNYHLKQAKKKCGIGLLSDTTIVRDTIYSTSVKKDSLFFYNQKDTVVIREGRLVMKYFYRDSTVYLKGECLTDTIYVDKTVISNTMELKPDRAITWHDWVLYGLMAFTLIVVLVNSRQHKANRTPEFHK